MSRATVWLLAIAIVVFAAEAFAAPKVVVGSKAFPESWVIGEAVADLARSTGADVEHRQNLGGTEITYAALTRGAIDVYPEYSGTLREVILRGADVATDDAMRAELARRGLGVTASLGFNDGYALAVSAATRDRTSVRAISDLARHPELRVGLTHEFLGRDDGYKGLARSYGLALPDVRGLQHELALDAIANGSVDVIDVYTTDAQLARLGLQLLDDDRHFFPRYDAVLVYRLDLATRGPEVLRAIEKVVGRIDEARMTRANAALVLDHKSVGDAAQMLLHESLGTDATSPREAPSVAATIAKNTARHLQLVALSLTLAIVVGVPLGIAATRSRVLAAIALGTASLLQTIPSLALLALLIPLLGIGAAPAIAALFLYGLLPILRGTHVGLTTISPTLAEAADAIGLPPRAKLLRVMLPLASPHIMSGIKTSAIINVGTATLAALIGAEGLGNPIMQGIALRDTSLILQGAVPAALLALAVQALFDGVERVVVPRGLRL